MNYRSLSLLSCALLLTPPADAQLISDRTVDDLRECVYVGSDQSADGQLTPRTTVVAASQPCPGIAPYRDPNRPIPGNAALVDDRPANDGRACVYTQGGVNYTRVVPVTQRCAMTPDLLDRALAARDPGTLGR
jgi:hypothetical protein